MLKIKMLSVFALMLIPHLLFADAKIGFSYSFSKTQLQPAEYSQIPGFEKFFDKEVVKFSRSIRKKTGTTLLFTHDKTDFTGLNSVMQICNISAAHTKDKLDETLIQFVVIIGKPNGERFEKQYASAGRVKMTSQWAPWVGVTRSAKFAISNIFKEVLNDKELIDKLNSIDKNSFFTEKKPVEYTPDAADAIKRSDFETRLKTLDTLRESGTITEREYLEKRKSILDEL